MLEAPASPFSAWENFYVIVGSAGGALTGLQFVVIALLTDLRKRRTTDQIDAFATPTVVHFCAVLLVSSVVSAPWEQLSNVAIPLDVSGAWGMIYIAVVAYRVSKQDGYKPVFEDWLFHTALPFLAYAMVLAGGITLVSHTLDAQFGVGSAMLLLLFIGVHNSWDTVTFIATEADKSEVQATEADDRKGPAKRKRSRSSR